MWTHTDNLCVSDLMFHVYIHMLPQKAFRTDYIDLTGRYQLQSAGRRQYTRPATWHAAFRFFGGCDNCCYGIADITRDP